MKQLPLGMTLAVVSVVALTVTSTAQAQPTLAVNGQEVTMEAPLAVIGDAIMAPLAPFAEAIEAEHSWNEDERLITIIRGQKKVEMWSGYLITAVDGQTQQSEASPFVVGTTIYIPVRFVVEAFGGHVSYDPAVETVAIDLASGTGQMQTIQGVIVQVYQGTPTYLLMRDNATNDTMILPLAENAQLTRAPEGAQPVAAQPGELEAGDNITATVVNGQLESVSATYAAGGGADQQPQLQHIRTTLGGATGDYLLLEGNQALRLSQTAEILDNAGNPINATDLQAGDRVLLIVDTTSNTVARVVRETVADAQTGDTTKPRFTGLTPVNNQTVQENDVLIRTRYTDAESGINPAATVIIFDGKDVTAEADVKAERMEYQATDLANGPHGVDVTITDQAGNTNRNQWTFVVASPADKQILSVKHNAEGPLGANQTLEVTAKVARPGGDIKWRIGNFKKDLTMERVGTTNTYRGTYTVRTGESGSGKITVSYRPPNETEWQTLQTEDTIQIKGQVPEALKVTTPKEGVEAPEKLVVDGYAPANHRIRVKIRANKKRFFDMSHDLDPQEVTVGENGRWATEEFGLKEAIYGWSDSYDVTIELLPPEGDTVIASVARHLKGR
ncbi:MAG: copper amine oxidase N-terminal domain-containing protein [Armatimonadota bacterium]